MFKRLEKHRQKKEDADKLELDDRLQEILGFHDTDSEESDSEDSNDEVEWEMQTSDSAGRVDYSEDEEDEDQDLVTVSQALTDPLYVASSLQPEVKACIICPGKVLKGLKMEELHLASNAHVRRFKHFSRLATDAKPTESARKLFRSFTKNDLNDSSTKPVSKRAEKRKIYHERQKQRRGKFKERMAKKAEQAVLSESGPVETKLSTPNEKQSNKPRPNDDFPKTKVERSFPTKKKRTIESHAPAALSEFSSPKRQKTMVKTKECESTSESDEKRTVITRIVRSTADRAKKARLKAIGGSKVSTSRHSKSSKHLS